MMRSSCKYQEVLSVHHKLHRRFSLQNLVDAEKDGDDDTHLLVILEHTLRKKGKVLLWLEARDTKAGRESKYSLTQMDRVTQS